MSSFDLPHLDRFTTGTVGPPGQRVFFLQAVGEGQVVTLRLEKAQVAAMAEYLAEMLSDLPPAEPEEVPTELDLVEPAVPEWVVGQIGVAFDESRDRMLIRTEEVPVGEEEAAALEPDPGVARFSVTRAQVAAFVAQAARLVSSGRPLCGLCGQPVDAEGHMCIKTNGHRQR